MNKKVWIGVIALAVVIIVLVFAIPRRQRPASLEIGAVIPLTGPSAQYGLWQKQGIDFASDEIARREGFDLRVDYEDSMSDPKTGVSAFRRLATGRSLCAITGVSGVVLALAPVAAELGFPQVNTSGQNPTITNAGSYTITLINLADVETSTMAKYAYEVLSLKRVGLLHSNVAAGVGAAEQFKLSFAQLGGSIVADESYDDNQTDYRSQVERVFSQKPEAVFTAGVGVNIARVIKQATELGHRTQWLSYSGFEGPEVETIAGSAANGTIFTSTGLDTTRNPEFIAGYEQRYGSKPELFGSTAYDAIFVVYEAYKSGAKSRTELTSTLTSGSFAHNGVTGAFTIKQNGTVAKPVVFKVFQDGEFRRAPKQLS